MDEDTDLLRRYAENGDEVAFAELVRGKVNLVHSAALRQVGGDAQLAQEVTQSVFINLARKAGSLSRHTSLAGWLYTSTRFAASKAVRAQARWRNRKKEAENMHELSSGFAGEPEWSQLKAVLDDAMGDLGGRDRDAVLLRYFEGRPLAEVGRMIGSGENAARMRVDRALEKLRTLLARRGITSSAVALGLAIAKRAVAAAPPGVGDEATRAALAAIGPVGTMIGGTAAKTIWLKAAVVGLLGAAAAMTALSVFQNRPAPRNPVAPAQFAAPAGGVPGPRGRGGARGGARGAGPGPDFAKILQTVPPQGR